MHDEYYLNNNKVHIAFSNPKSYKIDFDKVNTIEDIKTILKAFNITVYDNYENFEEIKPYLKEKE